MGLFRKGRVRSQSLFSGCKKPLLSDVDEDDDDDYNRSTVVYITRTRDGKPALGRKKGTRLLEDFGFDILGQSVGIPSRCEYEKRDRATSTASQSSGLIATPAAARRGRSTQKGYDNKHIGARKETESSRAHRKSDSMSSSIPASITTHHCHHSAPICTMHGLDSSSSSSRATTSVPLPPAPLSTSSWQHHQLTGSVTNGTAPTPMNHHGFANQPNNLSGSPLHGETAPTATLNWTSQQYPIAAQQPNVLVTSLPQAAAIPLPPHQQQVPCQQPPYVPFPQTGPGTQPVSMPQYPTHSPPPPPDQFQGFTVATGSGKEPQCRAAPDGNAENMVEGVNKGGKENMRDRLSRRIHHVHACSGCGSKRSARYQKAHPLKRGEVPAPNYCYKCLRSAAESDSESSDDDAEDTEDDYPIKKSHKRAEKPARKLQARAKTLSQHRKKAMEFDSSTDDDDAYTSDQDICETRRGPRRAEKSSPFRPLETKTNNAFAKPPKSRSSAAKTRSRSGASSVASSSRATRSAPKSRVRRKYKRANSFNDDETSSLSLRESDKGLWNEHQGLSYSASEVESESFKNKDKARTTSKNRSRSARTRTRSRRSRSQSQSASLNVDALPSTRARGRTHIVEEDRGSSRRETDNPARSVPISRHVEAEARRKHINPIGEKHKRAAAKQADTSGPTDEGARDRRSYPFETSNHVDGPSDPHYGYKSASTNRSGNPMNAASEFVFEEDVNRPMDEFHPNFPCHGYWMPRNATYSYGMPYPGYSEQPRRGDPWEAFQAPTQFHDWEEPMTPMDEPYTGNHYSPIIVDDMIPDYQAQLRAAEMAAEEMAERDLAFAGKNSADFSGNFEGSATSARPMSSFRASNLSIMSYNSDPDHSDGDTPTVGAKVRKTIGDVREKPARQIELSNGNERNVKFAMSNSLTEPFEGTDSQDSSRGNTKLPEQGRILYEISGDEESDGMAIECLPSPPESSLLGHTGYSSEDLATDRRTRGCRADKLLSD
ncbi:hypothetical protein GGR50DRAFT_353125 [Xylaria sp. CBS 124048]|nr:hypothetical protein GGR50DRAFT_353125 [Xylaria sp. CBS 124048]